MKPSIDIERILSYRHLAREWSHVHTLFSHQVSRYLRIDASQVRKDFKKLGVNGSTSAGYALPSLIHHIDTNLPISRPIAVILIAKPTEQDALLRYLSRYTDAIQVKAVLDGTLRLKTHDKPDEKLTRAFLETHHIRVAILALTTDQAQSIAERLVYLGIDGILNFSSVLLRLPPSVTIETFDLNRAVERAAFFAEGERMAHVQ